MGSEDEVKLFEKALSKCRTCDHVRMAHSYLASKKGRCLDAKLTNKDVYDPCNCTMFIPKDNLEFLEWAAQKKEKKS